MRNARALQRFEELIRARSGIQMRQQETALLDKTLAERTAALRFSTPERYLDFLCGDTAKTRNEWTQLFALLTNQESYFFRDAGQLAVIREHVLPELVRRNRDTRTLRIWSAGCSTGEEPYSLAMMLDDVLPFREGWRVLLLGTDLSETALERAQSGVYGAWSFRALDSSVQERFFLARGNKWEVKPHLRRAVTFSAGNLLLDEFPSPAGEMHDMDLIVCRNVFIYFTRQAVARVLRKFTATLRPGGFLITGHTELHDVPLSDLQTRTFPQTLVYQRTFSAPPRENKAAFIPAPLAASPSRLLPPATTTPSAPLVPPANSGETRPTSAPRPTSFSNSDQVVTQARTWIEAGCHGIALQHLQALLKDEPRHFGALCLAAQAQANTGCLDEAEKLCRQAIEVSPLAPLPYHVLARIAEERGDAGAAKIWLKKVIYLDPASVRAFLELGAIYAREGDATRAAQMQRSALGTLENRDEHSVLPPDEFAVEAPLTVGELRSQLRSNTS